MICSYLFRRRSMTSRLKEESAIIANAPEGRCHWGCAATCFPFHHRTIALTSLGTSVIPQSGFTVLLSCLHQHPRLLRTLPQTNGPSLSSTAAATMIDIATTRCFDLSFGETAQSACLSRAVAFKCDGSGSTTQHCRFYSAADMASWTNTCAGLSRPVC